MPSFGAANAGASTLQEAARLQGEGLRGLGKGIADVGTSIGNVAAKIESKQDELDVARAQSDWLIRKAKLDDERAGEQNQDVLRKEYPTRYQDALDGASTLIRNEQAREKFRLGLQPHVEMGGIHSNNRADDLQKDAFMAGVGQQLLDLRNAGLKAKDDATKADIVAQGGKLIDQLAENGYISQQQAQQRKNAWSTNFAEEAISALPPTQRMQALSPVNTGALAKQAMSFFQSKGWTPEQAAGIVGNLIHESGGRLDTNARAAGDGADGSDSIGIGQWNAERAKALKAFAAARGTSPTDYKTQLEFVQHELETSEAGAAKALRNATDVRGATEAFLIYERPKNYAGGLATAHGGANRLHQAQGIFGSLNGSGSYKESKLAGLIPEDRRKALMEGTEKEIISDLRQSAEVRRQQAASVKSLMSDDNASIMATGKPVDGLTPERVAQTMGPDAAASFTAERVRASNYYTETHDFASIPDDQIMQRVEGLKPKGGEAGFEAQQKYYDAAKEKAQAVLKARQTDPAGAVDSLPMVQAAKQGVDFNKPETIIPLAKARLAMQEAIGIPEGSRIPISKDEAIRVMAPVVNGLAGTEKQYLQKIVPMFQQAYGGYADRALQFALEQAKVDADSARVATSIFKKIGLGQPVTKTDQDALARAQTNDAMAKAAGSFAGQVMSDSMREQPQQAAEPTGSKRSDIRPPSEAIKALIQNPSRADEFDALFGKGMAKRVLTEHQTMTKGAKPNG